MKIKDFKIGTQLIVGFLITFLFVMLLGVVSYFHSNQLYSTTENLYNHPLQVRIALGKLELDVMNMRMCTRDLMIAKNLLEKQRAIELMEASENDANKQFELLKHHYLGPSSDISNAYNAFLNWEIARDENTKLALLGNNEIVKESVLSTGKVGGLRDVMSAKIKIIDDYATQKADSLFANSAELKDTLNRQLILLVICIVVIMILINYFLLKNIQLPIKELTDAASRFQNGDMNARSWLEKKNEFGILSDAFNQLVENIQINADMNEKSLKLSKLMLIEEDSRKFFHSTLQAISTHTNSQMAAVYLLSEDKKYFEHYESIGLDDSAKIVFSAQNFEGEFGVVLASHKIECIKDIPIDTRFVFQTVSGKIIPRALITIPILVNNEVVAIISLASVRNYSDQANGLINSTYDVLNARVEGILAYRNMRKFSEQLEYQNRELEAQKIALASQSIEVTEQNRELEMQKNQLHQANQLKTTFLSNMSHELRTPLNSVIALSGVLNRRLANKIADEEYSYLEVIERNGKHLLSLINDILDISRIESGREEIEINNFNLDNLISEIALMIKPQAEVKNVEMLLQASKEVIIVASDADKIRHILQNLIGNAVKFTEKGKVEIYTTQTNGKINISIADTGIGISDKHISHIFDEFRQADGGTSRKYGGNGLGLAIAKKYANLLGGSISVKSIPNEGSTFTLTLPLNYNPDNKLVEIVSIDYNPEIKKFAQVHQARSSTKTVLLVEDSVPAIIQMKDFLEESGYEILEANDGAAALKIIEHTLPDAIILDLMMPGVDGFEVLKSIRNTKATEFIPVLILTAKHITKEDLKFLTRNNIHQLIQKGDVNRAELLNAVESMVCNQNLEAVKPPLQTINGKPIVLVVEDNADNMITVKAILADNYIVLEAIDAVLGIELAILHSPNLIIMDIALPGMDGIEAFKTIRNSVNTEHIPVIALTASAMNSDREIILEHGFDAYIAKPIDETSFFSTINEVLFGK